MRGPSSPVPAAASGAISRPGASVSFVSDGPISSNSGRNGGKNAGRNCVSALPQRAIPVHCHPRFPSRNRRFSDRCRSPDCASTAFRCRCLLLRQKLFVLPCRRLRNNYILCPTGTPTFAALRRQRRDLIIANPVEANTPTVAGQAAAPASAPVNAGTVLLTDSDDRCTPPASTHCQIRTCCPRAKEVLKRSFKWFSLVPFFLQKKKGTRAGARNAPSPARRREIIPVGDKSCTRRQGARNSPFRHTKKQPSGHRRRAVFHR